MERLPTDKLRERLSEISAGSVGGLYPPPSVAHPKASRTPKASPVSKPTPPPSTPTPLLMN